MKRRALIIQQFLTDTGTMWEVRRPSNLVRAQNRWLAVALVTFFWRDWWTERPNRESR